MSSRTLPESKENQPCEKSSNRCFDVVNCSVGGRPATLFTGVNPVGWVTRILQRRTPASQLESVRSKFSNFLDILENNNRVLKIISDMEEKSQGDYLFDINYVRSSLQEIRSGVLAITEKMTAMGGPRYAPLRERYEEINGEISIVLPENRPVERDDFVVPLDAIGSDRSWSVGSKAAQLGEMSSRLGLPVPDGFAISAWAYKHFVEVNDLRSRISECIASVDVRRYGDLVRVSEQIRQMVSESGVPDDLAAAIREHCATLRTKTGCERFALRSSAVGEDSLFSFAGQYATFLDVREEDIVDRYRDILASRFSPKAISYYLSHSFSESELPMGVCCLSMVDARASGVIYTRDPVQSSDDHIVIYAVYGLGKYLVDGKLTPDVIRVSRDDGRMADAVAADKPVRLVLDERSGTREEEVPEYERTALALNENAARALASFARTIEEHYQSPMDIEWAGDRDGRIYLLQARPLRLVHADAGTEPDTAGLEPLCAGGATVCPGAVSGRVFHLRSTRDMSRIPDGAVLVTPAPFPGLVTVMRSVSALVAHVGSAASHMATLAREFRVPTIVGLETSCELPEGEVVTVDATGRSIYAGAHPELVEARRAAAQDADEADIYTLLRRVLHHISPLNLIHPDGSDYAPENCRTIHDIVRFAHQKAMEEMFSLGNSIPDKDRIAFRLKSDIPLKVLIIYIDQDPTRDRGPREVEEADIASVPMKAFWSGIKEEGWPARPPSGDMKGFLSVFSSGLATNTESDFSESSFAILGEEYMLLSLRMGYHFSTVESMCSDNVGKNYIRFQCKGGGASLHRRSRRINLFVELLSRMGFVYTGEGDFIDARLAYHTRDAIARNLQLLGRITMMTKQLDMALSNDAITRWYARDFATRLGLSDADGPPHA